MMHQLSNTIKDPNTGEILVFSSLFKGEKVIVTSEMKELYKMHPQSGVIKDANGNSISLVDLILSGGDLSNYYTKQEIEELILNAGVDGGGIDLSRYALVGHTHTEYALEDHTHTDIYTKVEVDDKFSKFVPPSNSMEDMSGYVLKTTYDEDMVKTPKVYIQGTRPAVLKAGDIWIKKNS